MDVTCPACAARYTADEQKLRGKTARMRCRACDTVWLVSGPEDKSMNEAAASPNRAAVVKRGAEREHRDLFATSGRGADFGSVKETLRPPPPDSNIGVGARNETSVLFTMDALKGNARVKTPEPEPAPLSSTFHVDDDEGVIDLKALASGPPKAGARHIAPLFSEPPPAAFAADVDGSGNTGVMAMPGGFKLGKRAFVGIAAAAVAVVLCSIGLAAAFRGEEPSRSAAAAMSAPAIAAPATPAPAVTSPAPAPAPIAAASSSSSSSDEDEPKASGVKKKGKKSKVPASFNGTKVQSSGVSKKSEPNQSKPAATPKAADKCGCKGEFNCILRCTAKGS